MSTEIKKEIQLEIAHVLFIDIVGYSKLLIDEQRDCLHTLNELVRATDAFCSADAAGKLTTLPTGDGMALVFATTPDAPVVCALQIAKALQNHPALSVRMGIHSGPVSGIVDVSQRSNIAGVGINIAQRVMDCGDAGHILLSKHVADDLAPYPRWNPYLHDLGECEVKHGAKVSVVNLYTDELGNPALPEKFAQAKEQPVAAAPSGAARHIAKHKPALIIALFLVIAALAIGSYWIWHPWRSASTAPSQTAKSIAVLPLLNESGNPKDEYFSDGLSEELIAALAQIRELKVIGRSSSFRFKERNEEPKTIGEKLGVATLLEGTVRKQGDRVRIVAELINAADGIELWSRTFDRELKDIFAVQQEIAKAVAESLKVTLLGSEEKSTEMATNSVEAHNAYLQARFHRQRGSLEDYRKAVTYFDRAIELDPNYALAYAERSEAWTIIGDLAGERPTAYPKARSDAEKAVAIAPNLAEAHAALGWVRAFAEWKFAEGLSELERAKELSPANPIANDLLARVIVYRGRLEEAELQAREAIQIDPLSAATQFTLGRVLFYAGKLEEATAAGRKMAELQPSASSSHRWQVLAAVQRGDGEMAIREAQLEPDESIRPFELALAQYIRGDRNASDTALAELIANSRDSLAYQIAEIYAVRHETDKAFEWLQIAFDNHDGGMPSLMVDPLLRDLRNDPRYKTLVAKMNFSTTP